MTVAIAESSAGLVPITFDIKSAQLPVLALILKTLNLTELSLDLARRFGPDGESPDYFDHDGVVLDFSRLLQGAVDEGQAQQADLGALLALLRQYRLVPIGYRGADEAMAQAARSAGLISAPEAVRVQSRSTAANHAESVTPEQIEPESVTADPAATHAAAPLVLPAATTLVIDKPLRSGQKAYARGGDLVVLAMVNQGAEVVADGNIHVYAPLRGKAMAGARGNTEARIFALSMEPELISIAGIYRTSENPLPDAVRGKPAQIRLGGADTDKLIFEPLKA